MKLLIVHQNMPGQYRELVQWLVAQGGHQIVFLTQRNPAPKIAGVTPCIYKTHHVAADKAYGLSKVWENAAGVGFGAMEAARKLERDEGFRPDLILGHTGWGELTFFKDLWPDVPILGFFEFYYNMTGGLVGFDPEEPVSEHTPYLMRARNVVPNMNLHTVDVGHVPTFWQRDAFPKLFHDKMYVCHDGIRTDHLRPNTDVALTLGRMERPLTRDDEVFTYLARNLEHARGFHVFMRALPHILAARPNARVLILGGNDVSYGRKSKHPKGLRGEMEEEVGDSVDWSRVHFLGRLPYENFCQVVQLSRCHLYLTMPFVLSWSVLEAMAMQATVVAADVAPVREAVTHGETGLLVDFFDPKAIADQVIDVLTHPGAYAHLGPAARAHVVGAYDFMTRCLPEHIRQMNALVPQSCHIPAP
ncbi:glycosyltransferase family 4 protein [Tropicibacter sp. Alg240-R139]|uniref:glycosyltransferase family 4 protein n=1 Tax=Tropicibacter sp. Alg240-R139 TaxID=2305991 RepID=UPI0013E0B9C0|nr:glycosyltransferase family 4 protein [Tropicibacter sp. Alg240-R139]